MSDICKIIGERVKNHRIRRRFSREELAERCGLHTTYIGQIERGEKNATLETIEKIIKGLDISYETLFEKIYIGESKANIAAKCYSIIDSLNYNEQGDILDIIEKIVHYKKNS